MYRVEMYAQVRRSVFVEGISEREAASRFGIARETVRKMLRYAAPPGCRRSKPASRPKLGPYAGIIDQILADDREQPRKQRHTAKRIHERLREEYGFDGGYSSVKEYVREQKLTSQEMFVPLAHPPGEAQADFGEAAAVIGGVQRKAHFLAVDLPHSDDAFVKAFPAETAEAFCEGHNAAFRYFGGVPRTIVYDNTKLAVAKILGDGARKRTRVFSELEPHYLFADRFGRPGKGNGKGKVEGLGWPGMRGGTSWFRSRAFRAGKRSTSSWSRSAWIAGAGAYEGMPRRSASVSSAAGRRCYRCRRRRTRLATNDRRG